MKFAWNIEDQTVTVDLDLVVGIPVATLGGAIPAAIGLLGAGLNYLVAGQTWPAFPRVVLMCIITSAAWMITVAVVFGVSMLLGT